MRRLRRHLWGLRAYLEQDASEDASRHAPEHAALPEAVGAFFMPRHRDPHALVHEALAREEGAITPAREVASAGIV